MKKENLKKQTVKLDAIKDMLHPVSRRVAEEVTKAPAKVPEDAKYCVFGPDYQLYGPVTVATLRDWAGSGSLARNSWIYDYESDQWCRALGITEVRELLPPVVETMTEKSCVGMEPSQLRRIRALHDMTNHDIEDLLPYLKRVEVLALQPVMRRGVDQYSMYMVLSGEAVIYQQANGRTQGIGALQPGDSFCEQCLVTPSPGLYDIDAREDLTLLRMHYKDFERLRKDHVELAMKLLSSALLQVSLKGSRVKAAGAKEVVRQVEADTAIEWRG
jgi:CRP-like cAMP-binding protein